MTDTIRKFRTFCAEARKHKDIIAFRFFVPWLRSQQGGRSPINDKRPWITFEAVEYLNRYIKNHHRVFEYGVGGSTLYFLARAKEVTSIEHDKNWFTKISELIKLQSSHNWHGRLIEAEPGNLAPKPDVSAPKHYASADALYQGANFQKYASSIDEFPDGYFDIVLVDGRARPSCIAHALSKVKAGGLLVVDNSERDYYFRDTREHLLQSYNLVLDRIGPIPHLDYFTSTSIWQRKT
jgi:hypothetical protein